MYSNSVQLQFVSLALPYTWMGSLLISPSTMHLMNKPPGLARGPVLSSSRESSTCPEILTAMCLQASCVFGNVSMYLYYLNNCLHNSCLLMKRDNLLIMNLIITKIKTYSILYIFMYSICEIISTAEKGAAVHSE